MADNQTLQRDQDVVTYEAFTGLRSDVTPERFGPSDLVVGDNVDLDKSGKLSRRDGYTLKRAGATHSLWADELQQWCLFVAGGTLWRLNADYSATALRPVVLTDARMSYARVNDRIYFLNGLDAGVIECATGAVRSWGLPVPPLPVVTRGVGLMPAGTYQYAITWLRSDGQESGAPLAGSITVPAGSSLVGSLPSPIDPDIAAANLYLSTPDGDMLYLAQLAITGNTFTYGNDTTELNLPLATQFMQGPPVGHAVAYYRGVLYVAHGDTLFPSTGYGFELFDLREYIPLDGRVTLLAPLTDKEMAVDSGRNSGIFVGTDRSCGALVGGGPREFQYVPKTPYGAIEGALDFVDGSLFGDDSAGAKQLPVWLTTQGLCVGLPDMTIRNITRSKYVFAAAGQGAALFMPGPNRFIASANL
jgi:hypothetical protein